MNKTKRYSLGILVVVICSLLIIMICSTNFPGVFFEKKHSRNDAVLNYVTHDSEIQDLVNYINYRKPDSATGKGVSFGFGDGFNSYNFGIFFEDGSFDKAKPNPGGANLSLSSEQMVSTLKELKWTSQTIDTLKNKLKRINCSHISTGEPTRITYVNGESGIFSYLVFSKNLPDSVIEQYKKDYGDSVINRKVVITYTAGL